MDDILIKGGQVIDGTGAPGRSADLAIRAGRIAAIEANRTESADRVIDGHGCVVAPGFIDIHTHSDFTLPLNRKAECKIRQGVTTEVDGWTLIPVTARSLERFPLTTIGPADSGGRDASLRP